MPRIDDRLFRYSMNMWRRCWLALGLGWVALVVYLSLANIHLPQISVSWSDKLNHFVAYGFLMGWFGLLYQRQKARLLLACCLIVLGVVMEVFQGRLPYRWFDVLDAVASAGGVLFAWLMLYFGVDKFLSWFELRFGQPSTDRLNND